MFNNLILKSKEQNNIDMKYHLYNQSMLIEKVELWGQRCLAQYFLYNMEIPACWTLTAVGPGECSVQQFKLCNMSSAP